MKRFCALVAIVFSCITSWAQLSGTGYYRVQNTDSERFIIVTNNQGSINYTSTTVDFSSLLTIRNFSNVESNPASVIYFDERTPGQYVLSSQGTDTYTLSGGYLLKLTSRSDGSYMAGATQAGMTKYVCDSKANGDMGKITDNNSARRCWWIKPVDQTANQYFGLKPETDVTVYANGLYYRTFFAAFPFSFASSGMKAYCVETVDHELGIAVYSEISGAVPSAAPVIVSFSSGSSSQNKFNVGAANPVSLSSNQLTGVYFDRYDYEEDIDNRTLNNPSTMRLLGLTASGKLGFVKSSLTAVPHNTAYLSVPATAPAEYVLMTRAEYETEKARLTDVVTVTAKNVSRNYGEANPSLEYTVTGTGTLKGQPSLSCAATTASPVGAYPIVVGKGSVTNYSFTGVNGTLTVTKAPLTVTADSYTIKQTQPWPTLTLSYAGFKNGETEAVLTSLPTLSTDAPADKKPGVYNIYVSGGEAGNYEMNRVAGKLTILEADPITLRADDKTMAYGDPVPAFTYTVTGGTVTGTPNISSKGSSQSPVGVYPILINAGTISYPNLKVVSGSLTITAAPLTVTADSYTIKQNQPWPKLTLSYDGFRNGDSEAVLTSQPVLTTDAPADKTPGVYNIYVSGGSADNYQFKYVAGKLTILEADPVTVTAKSYTRAYGDALAELGYTIDGAAALDGVPNVRCDAGRLSPVGTYPIIITRGSITYPNLKLVDGTLTVTKAPLTVTAQSYTIKQTDELPELELTISGFANGEDAGVLTAMPVATVSVPADKTPGVYDIVVSGGEADNYSFDYVAGQLTIVEADAIVVRALDAEMTYGDDVPQFAYEVVGGELTGEPAISCEATSRSDAGEYAITIGQGTLSAYPNLQFVSGTLTIGKAPLTVSVADAEMTQGDPLPDFVLLYDGFRNGDDESVLLSKPVATTSASSESPAGKYAVEVSGGEAANYVFSYVGGTLTIEVRSSNISTAMVLDKPIDVYTITGRKVLSQTTTLRSLRKGVYIVDGRKVVVE